MTVNQWYNRMLSLLCTYAMQARNGYSCHLNPNYDCDVTTIGCHMYYQNYGITPDMQELIQYFILSGLTCYTCIVYYRCGLSYVKTERYQGFITVLCVYIGMSMFGCIKWGASSHASWINWYGALRQIIIILHFGCGWVYLHSWYIII